MMLGPDGDPLHRCRPDRPPGGRIALRQVTVHYGPWRGWPPPRLRGVSPGRRPRDAGPFTVKPRRRNSSQRTPSRGKISGCRSPDRRRSRRSRPVPHPRGPTHLPGSDWLRRKVSPATGWIDVGVFVRAGRGGAAILWLLPRPPTRRQHVPEPAARSRRETFVRAGYRSPPDHTGTATAWRRPVHRNAGLRRTTFQAQPVARPHLWGNVRPTIKSRSTTSQRGSRPSHQIQA